MWLQDAELLERYKSSDGDVHCHLEDGEVLTEQLLTKAELLESLRQELVKTASSSRDVSFLSAASVTTDVLHVPAAVSQPGSYHLHRDALHSHVFAGSIVMLLSLTTILSGAVCKAEHLQPGVQSILCKFSAVADKPLVIKSCPAVQQVCCCRQHSAPRK